MHDRIIDVSSSGGRIRYENGLVALDLEGTDGVTIPVEDVAVLILDNARLTVTQPVLSALAAGNVPVVVTDGRHLPSGMFLPLSGNARQTEFFRAQALAPLPVRKRAWKEIVKCKILRQAEILKETRGDDAGLAAVASAVRSGDTTNREGFAAQKYWSSLGLVRKRDRYGDDANIFLNYGYSILHAMASRAVCGAGLHPTIGINHRHRNNPFCLASDVMEPFRPLVDYTAWKICGKHKPVYHVLDRKIKAELLSVFTRRILVNGMLVTVFDALSALSVALRKRFIGENAALPLPEKLVAERILDR